MSHIEISIEQKSIASEFKNIKSKGFIYVFTDPGVPNEFKIGHSSREVEVRRSELSKETSRPRALIELYRRTTFSDPKDTETKIHKALKKLGYWLENSDKKINEWFSGDLRRIVQIVDNAVNIDNTSELLTLFPDSSSLLTEEMFIASNPEGDRAQFFNLCLDAYNGKTYVVEKNWAIQAAKMKIGTPSERGEYLWILADHSRFDLENYDDYVKHLDDALRSNWLNDQTQQKCRNILIKIYSSGAYENFEKLMSLLASSTETAHKVQWAYTMGNGVKFLVKPDPTTALKYLQSLRLSGNYVDVLRYIFDPDEFSLEKGTRGVNFSQYQFDESVYPPSLEYFYLEEVDEKIYTTSKRSSLIAVIELALSSYYRSPEVPSIDKIEAYYITACNLLRNDFECYFTDDDCNIRRLTHDVDTALSLFEIAAQSGHKRAAESLYYQYSNGPKSIRCSEKAQHYRQLASKCEDDTHLKFPCFGLKLVGERTE